MMENSINDIYILSEEEIQAIQYGINQIEGGDYLSNDEANILIDKLLKRETQ